MNRFIVEPDDKKTNGDESDEEYLAVDDDYDDIESNKEANTAMTSITSSTKPQLSNFSVLSLLGRRSPDKEKEKQSLADNSSQKEIHFPSNGEDVTEDVDQAEQSSQVIK